MVKYIRQAMLEGNSVRNNIVEEDGEYKVVIPENTSIVYVGVQGLPGIRLGLGSTTKNNPVYLNGNGFFELDLQDTGAFLTSIYINKNDFEARAKINNSKGYLIIDYIAVSNDDLKKEEGTTAEGGNT